MAEAVNRLPFNAEARIRFQPSPHGTFSEGWHWDRFFFEYSDFLLVHINPSFLLVIVNPPVFRSHI